MKDVAEESPLSCEVYVFKEGLLSAVAHDLRLRVERCRLELSEDRRRVEATFDATSIVYEAVMREGRADPSGLSARDARQVAENIRKEVLHTRRHPEIRFTSDTIEKEGRGYRVRGALLLHGRTRDLTLTARPEGGRMVAEVTLHQPDFGIKPFRAMMGTLKIKPDVRVRLIAEIDEIPTHLEPDA